MIINGDTNIVDLNEEMKALALEGEALLAEQPLELVA